MIDAFDYFYCDVSDEDDWLEGFYGSMRTRDGYDVTAGVSVRSVPLRYKENYVFPDRYTEPKCEGLVIGINFDREDPTIITAPLGTDVHGNEWEPEQARKQARLLNRYADYVDELRARSKR